MRSGVLDVACSVSRTILQYVFGRVETTAWKAMGGPNRKIRFFFPRRRMGTNGEGKAATTIDGHIVQGYPCIDPDRFPWSFHERGPEANIVDVPPTDVLFLVLREKNVPQYPHGLVACASIAIKPEEVRNYEWYFRLHRDVHKGRRRVSVVFGGQVRENGPLVYGEKLLCRLFSPGQDFRLDPSSLLVCFLLLRDDGFCRIVQST
mmetsp:Transcript_3662/g.8373  ORF Transcript_3662/g.8373 Transcript_3662/m.8373 type:complete len:205 (-) Transcript_3662:404-1018(-)